MADSTERRVPEMPSQGQVSPFSPERSGSVPPGISAPANDGEVTAVIQSDNGVSRAGVLGARDASPVSAANGVTDGRLSAQASNGDALSVVPNGSGDFSSDITDTGVTQRPTHLADLGIDLLSFEILGVAADAFRLAEHGEEFSDAEIAELRALAQQNNRIMDDARLTNTYLRAEQRALRETGLDPFARGDAAVDRLPQESEERRELLGSTHDDLTREEYLAGLLAAAEQRVASLDDEVKEAQLASLGSKVAKERGDFYRELVAAAKKRYAAEAGRVDGTADREITRLASQLDDTSWQDNPDAFWHQDHLGPEALHNTIMEAQQARSDDTRPETGQDQRGLAATAATPVDWDVLTGDDVLALFSAPPQFHEPGDELMGLRERSGSDRTGDNSTATSSQVDGPSDLGIYARYEQGYTEEGRDQRPDPFKPIDMVTEETRYGLIGHTYASFRQLGGNQEDTTEPYEIQDALKDSRGDPAANPMRSIGTNDTSIDDNTSNTEYDRMRKMLERLQREDPTIESGQWPQGLNGDRTDGT